MSVYETIAVIFSSVALITSVPAIFLTIRQFRKMSFKIEFKLECSSKIFFKNDQENIYNSEMRFLIINKSDQTCTINRITAVDIDSEFELYTILWNGSSSFTNVPLNSNQILSRMFAFSLKNLPKNKLTFKIYTNRKIFTIKIPYQLRERQFQQSRK